MTTISENNIKAVTNQKVDLYDRKDSPNAPTVNKGRNSLNENFDNFLTLLTTQLRYQDPTNPVDNHEFTNQLVLFSGVEQQIRGNDYLKTLVDRLEQSSRESAVNYLGKEIEVKGNRFRTRSEGESVSLHYQLADDAADVVVSIVDGTGRTIRTLSGGLKKDDQFLVWNGLDSQGNPVSPGTYRYVVNAKGSEGQEIPATQFTTVRIGGVGYENGETLLISETGDVYPIRQVSALRDTFNPSLQLSDILSAIRGSGDTNLLQYIGRLVETESNRFSVGSTPGNVDIRYDVDSDKGEEAEVRIIDSSNNVVYKAPVSFQQGSHTYTWDGQDQDGNSAPQGDYRVVVQVLDANGEPQPTFIYLLDTIVSINREAPTPVLVTAGGHEIPPGAITRLL